MLAILPLLAIAPVYANPDWTLMWSNKTNAGIIALPRKAVGLTVLTYEGVLHIDSGRIEKLTQPQLYADPDYCIDLYYAKKPFEFGRKPLIYLSHGDHSTLAFDPKAGLGQKWLYQVSDEGKLIGSIIRTPGDRLGTANLLFVDWPNKILYSNDYQGYRAKSNMRLYLLSPLRRSKVRFCHYSDFKFPKQGVLAYGDETNYRTHDQAYDSWNTVTLSDPYTGKKLWAKKNYTTAYWLTDKYILAMKTDVKKGKRGWWSVLDSKTGRTTDISVPIQFDYTSPNLWIRDRYVIFRLDDILHCYRFNRR